MDQKDASIKLLFLMDNLIELYTRGFLSGTKKEVNCFEELTLFILNKKFKFLQYFFVRYPVCEILYFTQTYTERKICNCVKDLRYDRV